MSFLRRRFGGANNNDSPIESREPSPKPGETRPSNLRVITAEQLHTLKKKGKSKRKNAWIFGLGGLFGLVVAGFFASSNEMIDLKSLENMNLDSILDALPASFVNSAQQLQVRRSTQRPQGAWNGSSGKEVLQRVLISSTQ
jgi:phospholipid:diacylglycerol acyltransferase